MRVCSKRTSSFLFFVCAVAPQTNVRAPHDNSRDAPMIAWISEQVGFNLDQSGKRLSAKHSQKRDGSRRTPEHGGVIHPLCFPAQSQRSSLAMLHRLV